jgi:hypothetical protein
MAIKSVCPNCGTKEVLLDRMAGRRIRCAECNTAYDVTPNPVETDVAEEDVPSVRRRLRLGFSEPGALPWFYGYLESGVRLMLALAICAFGVTAVIALVFLVWALAPNEAGLGRAGAFFFLACIVGALAAVLAQIFFLCFLLLAIDIGKTLHEIKRNTRHAEQPPPLP